MPALGPRNGAATVAISSDPADPRGPGGDGAPPAQALDQNDRRQLQELHGERHRCQHADRDIAGAQAHRVTDQEHAGCERAHGLAGQRVVEHQPEGPVRRASSGRCRRVTTHAVRRQRSWRAVQAQRISPNQSPLRVTHPSPLRRHGRPSPTMTMGVRPLRHGYCLGTNAAPFLRHTQPTASSAGHGYGL